MEMERRAAQVTLGHLGVELVVSHLRHHTLYWQVPAMTSEEHDNVGFVVVPAQVLHPVWLQC